MSSSHIPDKAVATSSQRKCVRSRGNVPPSPAVFKGQTRRFGVKVVKGKAWWKKHIEATYFSDVCLDRDNLARDCIWSYFAEPKECNLHMVCEFYTNWAPDARSHFVTMRRVNVPITLVGTNDILVVLKSAILKALVHKGLKYAFGGLITKMCRVADVPEENVDYMAPDELIMARIYGLKMLRHQIGFWVSTDAQFGEVERCYPLNGHAKALLGIGPKFHEPIDNDILTDEERFRTNSDVESDLDEEADPTQAGDEAEGREAMED
ncbi:hypothetical protein R3W88_016448 [Solanum pinnatisectum]|uniref:Uncharacterized protein n=1 Tax=Solanum pinnatisectum TaxID=50273 RepID=A0AAV9KZS7_9SOLN|nr:hypothetical protein R3W88_016448 [Solanum pinnatisectum]